MFSGSYIFLIKLSKLTQSISLIVIALLSWRQIAQSLISVAVYNYRHSRDELQNEIDGGELCFYGGDLKSVIDMFTNCLQQKEEQPDCCSA